MICQMVMAKGVAMTTPIKEGTHWRHRIIVTGVRLSGTFDTKGAALKWEAQQRPALSSGLRLSV
jgi:hypothetical protein